jgi:hypothetical protein
MRSRGNKKQKKHGEYNIEEPASKDFDMSYINRQKDRLKKMNGDDE